MSMPAGVGEGVGLLDGVGIAVGEAKGVRVGVSVGSGVSEESTEFIEMVLGELGYGSLSESRAAFR